MADPALPLASHSALVTGGATGIGLACARRLLRDGCSVTIAGRRADRLATAEGLLRAEAPSGTAVAAIRCDVSVEADVEAAVERAASLGDGLGVVVAAAGTGSLGPLVSTELGEWEQILATNLTGTFLTFKHGGAAVARHGGGALCAISSIASSHTHRFMGPYCVSKAGVDALVRNLADELGPAGVRVSSVRPGLVDTELVELILAAEEIVGDYHAQMPLHRVGAVEDVAEAVRFLCGPESSWITGVTLQVDGGHHLRRGPDLTPAARLLFADSAPGVRMWIEEG